VQQFRHAIFDFSLLQVVAFSILRLRDSLRQPSPGAKFGLSQ